MKDRRCIIMGIHAPKPRATFVGAVWLASLLSVPVFLLLSTAELIWRWVL